MKRRGFLRRLGAFLGFGAAAVVVPMALLEPAEVTIPVDVTMEIAKSPKVIRGPVYIELVVDGERFPIGQFPSLEYSKKKFRPVPVIQDWKPTEGQFTLKFEPIDA